MISLETAQKLKAAGLKWTPAQHDFFAIPERNLDNHRFVISDMLVTVEVLGGSQIVSFQGASEWALDYLVTADVVWMPREDQLRGALEALLWAEGRAEVRLISGIEGYICDIMYRGQLYKFYAHEASEAYAAALISFLGAVSQPQTQ